jgi:hypothetical protein
LNGDSMEGSEREKRRQKVMAKGKEGRDGIIM